MSRYLLLTGGTIFLLLGLLHFAFTVADLHRPRRLVPLDLELVDQLASAGLRVARGRTNMWDAWIGFNFSHSLGLVVFGLVCAAAGIYAGPLALPRATLLIPVLVGVIYFLLAIRFWFSVPAAGVAAATGLLFLGWALYPG